MMKRKKAIPFLLSLGAAITGVFAIIGCETSEGYSIEISPTYATVNVDSSISLQATGWRDYNWTLSNPNIGYLTTTRGENVTYVAKDIGTQTITAKSTGAASSTGTNSTSSAYSASATIIQQ